MQALGGPIGKTIFLKGAESHKLHQAFTVATEQEIKVGQPIVLNAAGEAVAAAADATTVNIVGYSIHKGVAGDVITVAMKAYGIIYAMSNAAVNAGGVAYAGQNTKDKDYVSVKTAAAGTQFGWCLDKASAENEIVRVAIY